MKRIAPSILIGPSSNLQVTRTGKTSRTSLNSGKIRLVTLELLALERLKKCYEHNSSFLFCRISIKLADNKNRHKILEFDFQSDRTICLGVSHS